MRSKAFVFVMFCFLVMAGAGLARAQVIVNGVAGGDADGASPFETLQAAAAYALANRQGVIEIQTNGPIAGLNIITPTEIPVPLTIRAGQGFAPVINANVSLIPGNPDQQVTLEGLKVELPNGSNGALWVGCNLRAVNCRFTNVPGGGLYHAAIICATGGPATNSKLVLERCFVRGHIGLQAGRSVRDYEVYDSTIIGQVSDLPTYYSSAIANNMNWMQDFSARLDAGLGLSVVTEPRSLKLYRSVIQGGTLIGWPPATLDASYVSKEANTIGPIEAVNCIFLDGDAVKAGHGSLPTPNTPNVNFKHCTWRNNVWGAVLLQGPASSAQFWNCLFDMPTGEYAIGATASNTRTITGDANVYNVRDGRELIDVTNWDSLFKITPFEATAHHYTKVNVNGAFVSNATGRLTVASLPAFNHAVVLSPAVADDIDGNRRPLGPGYDVGAHEVIFVPVELSTFAVE